MRRIGNSKICPILSAKLSSQSREELPVIVQGKNYSKLNNLIFDMSGEVRSSLPLIGGIACKLSTESIYRLAEDIDIDYISFDSKVFALLDIASASVEANLPHRRGYTGEGVTVAIIDTGTSPHSDLLVPNERIVGFKDFVNNRSSPYDDNGHGTHIAGIIAGSGYSSNGKYTGIAPKANILPIKALDENGSGNTSDIIKAISWAIETKNQYNTKIINLSLGSPVNNPCSKDPLCKATKEATDNGLVVVVAAGNSGPSKKSILSPGISPNVITVGAVDDKRTPNTSDDTIASFSSRGPTKEGLNKPDIVAPGVNIMSLSNTKQNGYTSLSGTSMATPVISGAIALLLEKENNLSPNEIKRRLAKSCIDLKEYKEDQGSGMISLNKLFRDSLEDKNNNLAPNEKPSFSSRNPYIENILTLLFVLFLLKHD
ncbi:S8 family peptidase [Anaerosalibacter bizertensis]|uniref:S8 family peptidase n=1 Tax=Anaerosalibacter bizertensis TaxID=932217 RepID=UPI001C0EBA59|nr:S8 family peptidase [Anaerosalibacter bizertensis]MBU5294424.1 S8 family peptidase [Anaerosalibacter bizertensis]MCG4582961.1 S8 family peptidase [Anaerosalibacter bizertensis]